MLPFSSEYTVYRSDPSGNYDRTGSQITDESSFTVVGVYQPGAGEDKQQSIGGEYSGTRDMFYTETRLRTARSEDTGGQLPDEIDIEGYRYEVVDVHRYRSFMPLDHYRYNLRRKDYNGN